MRKTTTRRKANTGTAMVFNPNRGLSVGRSTVRKSAARKNPVRRIRAAAKVNPRRRTVRRRRNPASITGTMVAAFMTAVGVVGFDLAASRIAPANGGAFLRIGVKAGGAYVFQEFGRKLPIIGKYNTEIALVLGTLAFVDGLRAFVLPWVSQTVSGMTGGNINLISMPQAGADSGMGNIYGNSPYRQPIYV